MTSLSSYTRPFCWWAALVLTLFSIELHAQNQQTGDTATTDQPSPVTATDTAAQIADTVQDITGEVEEVTLQKLGDGSDGNRIVQVHKITPYTFTGSRVRLTDQPVMPISPRQTCEPCHNYDTVTTGWHFNYNNPEVPAGRPGEPYILIDKEAATQIPLSHREWSGTFHPETVGMNPWWFVQEFGGHLPGGGVGENLEPEELELYWRWLISGDLEINCMSCHNLNRAYDHAEWDLQIQKQNFRWAATGALGYATVKGNAAAVPDNYDIYQGVVPDEPLTVPPTVYYDESAFNVDGMVFFDVGIDVPNERCYFCHSNDDLDVGEPTSFAPDEDVHMEAGMQCVDCHREGLDHQTIRGYPGEAEAYDRPAANESTCEGCHIGDEENEIPYAGRLAAPRPKHAGIPTVHFEEMTCTSCHSGPWPTESAHQVKTSRAHGLGLHGVNKNYEALPHIQAPVFVKGEDGKIGPNKLMWPAYWGLMTEGEVQPISPDTIRALAAEIIQNDTVQTKGWPNLTEDDISEVLIIIGKNTSSNQTPVYVGGGKVFQLNAEGNLVSEQDPIAKPYSWPMAHDVRPAEQSLGVKSCSDCHSQSSGFYFGKVGMDSPVTFEEASYIRMTEFQELGSVYSRVFAFTFLFRPGLKIVIFGASVVIMGVLILYSFLGLATLVKAATGEF